MNAPPPLHRGSVVARAIWLDPRWRTAAALRRDALTLWEPGAIVQVLDGGLLVRFPTARRLRCADAPGLVLAEVRDGLWAWAPTPDEVAAAAPGHLHRVLGGRRDAIPLATLPDAELWRALTIDGDLVDVAPLGPPPAPLPVPVVADARARMGRPPPDPAAVAILEELSRRGAGPPEQPSWLARAAAGLLDWLDARRPTVGGGAGEPGAPSGTGAASTLPAQPPSPSWLEALARRLAAPLLAPILGRQHGRYLQDLLGLFEDGDLDAALKRAIPLGGDGGPPLPPALGMPSPRQSLQLSFARASGSSIHVDDQLLKVLRDTYQRALDKLVAEGKVEDAAFVLIELLREHRKAIDLLEKHGKYALAAEIAEATHQGPEVAVRLWVRAGQVDRALAIARRTGSFAVCVPIVEAVDADRGRAFRAAWAAHLAAGGDPAAAVGVTWHVPTLRPLALRWLDDALRMGGTSAYKLLPLRLVAEPARFDEVHATVAPLLSPSRPGAADTPEDRALRAALAEGLVDADSPGARALARPLLRRLVVDQAAVPARIPAALLTRLRDRAADPVLAADLPAFAPTPPLTRGEPVRVVLDATDRGSAPVRDLAVLPRGRVLLALGEAGCRVVDRDGRVLSVLDQPADALVVHDAGTRAIAVALRDGGARLARLDLEAGTAAPWIEAPMAAFTRTYDGSLWFLADGDALLALDPLADRPTVLWRVTTGGPILTVGRGAPAPGQPNPGGISAVVGGDIRQIWRYTLPNLRLTERAVLPADDWPGRWLQDDGTLLEAHAVQGDPPHLPVRALSPGKAEPTSQLLTANTAEVTTLTRRGGCTLLAGRNAADLYVNRADGSLATHVEVRLLGASRVVTRLTSEHLAVGDDLGRVEVYALDTGARAARARV